MGTVEPHYPVLLVLAAFSRRAEALQWARERSAEQLGGIAFSSDIFPFNQTEYYQAEMGTELKKVFFAFENLVDPACLADVKHLTNEWEKEYREHTEWPESRPLNLDPGYVTQAKLVLATTKDRDHRVYLKRGIYAEVTLHYQRGRGWSAREWTYPDYRSDTYHQFFTRCRNHVRERKHAR
jgi:hypothetical protein